jgi:hypothetical protein
LERCNLPRYHSKPELDDEGASTEFHLEEAMTVVVLVDVIGKGGMAEKGGLRS